MGARGDLRLSVVEGDWISWSEEKGVDAIPEKRVVVTPSEDDATCRTFLGRGKFSGHLLPGMFYPIYHSMTRRLVGFKCSAAWNKQSVDLCSFEVLVERRGRSYKWIVSSNGQVPVNAVIGGRLYDGQVLYIGRVPFVTNAKEYDLWEVGPVDTHRGVCVISYSNSEKLHRYYEILVEDK